MKRLYLLGALLCSSANADIFEDWTAHTYGSFRAGFTDSDGENIQLLEFYDENDKWQFDKESLIGIQFNAPLTNKLSGVLQVVSRGSNDWDIETKWAYLKYDASQNYTIKLGRMAIPLFHHSQTEYIGYLHDFARLPKAVYIGHEFNTIDGLGIDAKYWMNSEIMLKAQFHTGKWKGQFFQSVTNEFFEASADNVHSLVLGLEASDADIFAGKLLVDINSSALDEGIDQLGLMFLNQFFQGQSLPPLSVFDPLFERMYTNGKKTDYNFAGFSYRTGPWTFAGEISYYGIRDSIDSFNRGWYLSATRCLGRNAITVHVEQYRQPPEGYKQLEGLPPLLYETGRQAMDIFAAREFEAVGINWKYDYSNSFVLKADVTLGHDQRDTIAHYRYASFGFDFIF